MRTSLRLPTCIALAVVIGVAGPATLELHAATRHIPPGTSPPPPIEPAPPGAPGSQFQIAFVTRLESTSFSRDNTIYYKRGKAESLQMPEPGVMIGSYVEQVLLNDPETDFARGLFRIRETLTTDHGSLTWEAVVLLIGTGMPFYGDIGWASGTITRGTGWFSGAVGTVEIAGRNTLCNPSADPYCVPSGGNPGTGECQDFNLIIRGSLP